ncbi:MAG: glycosyltransferase [Candidatus Tritonobacter lacicola]|nr:glycosyltransferase [Candidatus Tritonobacter lacicola]
MKVLQVNKYFYPKSGSERILFNQCRLLEQSGHQVIHFSMQHSLNLPSKYAPYFVKEIDYTSCASANALTKARMFFKLIYSVEAERNIARLLDDEKPDIAHIHKFNQIITPSILGPLKKRGVPVVQMAHDYKRICPNYNLYDFSKKEICEACKGGRYYSPIFRRCLSASFTVNLNIALEAYFHALTGAYEKIDTFICSSRFIKDKFYENGISAKKLVHIPNFLPLGEFQSADPEPGSFAYIGRIEHHKGVRTLIDAASSLKGARLVIAGDGSARADLERHVEERGLSNIQFVGHLPLTEVKNLLSKSMFTVVPSEWYENCPMSILEAQGMGIPVIGSDIGGIPELIEDTVDGFIFEPGNAEDLKEKIALLLESPRRAREMGRSGRLKVEREYNPQLFYERLMSVYSKLM